MSFRKFMTLYANKIIEILVHFFPFLKKKGMKQFIKFGLLSIIGTFVNLLILYLFTEYIGFYYMISAVFAFIAGMTTNFILNKRWTFLEKVREDFLIKYVKYFLISIIALGASLLLLYILTEFIGIYYILSQFLATSASFIVNFFGNKKWVFKDQDNL